MKAWAVKKKTGVGWNLDLHTVSATRYTTIDKWEDQQRSKWAGDRLIWRGSRTRGEVKCVQVEVTELAHW